MLRISATFCAILLLLVCAVGVGRDLIDILEILRNNVEKANMEVNGVNVKITISIGAISIIPPFNEYERYLKMADDNLYKAKTLGRNKVVIA